ncbi:MAG: malectin domain-containing carbohydrate-binding protein [Terriglobia bacterium]
MEKAAVANVLSSTTFAKCANLAKLLEYICQKYFEGSAADLKEYNIGIDALGRPPEFDPATNSIVRVEVHRLREKLKKYYQDEGRTSALMISLPPGSYIPQFLRRDRPVQSEGAEEGRPARTGPPGSSRATAPRQPARSAQPPDSPAEAPTIAAPPLRRWVSGLKQPVLVKFYLLAILGLAIAIAILAVHNSGTLPGSPLSATTSAEPESNAARQSVRILAGYSKAKYIDRAGNVWQGDRDYEGGAAVSQPQAFFFRTLDPTLFKTMRQGDFSYNIPLRPGTYELRLYFAETTYGPDTLSGGGEASRVFSVDLNGKPLLSTFDVLSDSGGTGIADVRVFKDVTPGPDGYLHLKFVRGASDPFVNAIEVVPSERGRMNPVRIAAQDDCFTDHSGHFWSADRYFEGGRLARRKTPVANTPDPGLYAGERFGNFNYAIPVAEGKYRVTLRFAETYFGNNNPGGGGAGSRMFDVYCNGAALLRNFDVFRQAGGEDRALEESFTGLRPNAQGKLLLRFVPVVNYASVNAVEVVDESE